MSVIKVRIPAEIEEYQERVFLGLSLRQLVAVGIGIGVVLVFVYIFYTNNYDTDLLETIAIVVGVLVYCIGFWKKNTFTFEKYLQVVLHHTLNKNKIVYTTELQIDNFLEKKGVKKHVWFKRKKSPSERPSSTKETVKARNKSFKK